MPNKMIIKSGEQSADDPFTFVMSSDRQDLVGDIVEQDWNLGDFRKNPIALFSHESSNPIGVWKRVRVEGNKLIGKLELAAEGTSEFIDTLRRLIEQRILRAVSVGFYSGEREALDANDPWGGLRLSKNRLLECSLVSVPANPDAISLAKSFGAHIPDRFFAEAGTKPEPFDVGAAKQLGLEESQRSGATNPKPTTKRNTAMSLQARIKAARDSLTASRNTLTELVDKDVEGLSAEELEDHTDSIDDLTGEISSVEGTIARLLKVEEALAAKAFDNAGVGNSNPTPAPAPAAPSAVGEPVRPITSRSVIATNKRASFAIACMVKAHCNRLSAIDVARDFSKDATELSIIIRAATDPASMTDATWAGPLVQETWGAFLELIRDMSVYPSLPGLRLEFDRYGKITMPRNDGRGNLAGGFVGELVPIPVKEGIYGSVDMAPKKMAVISSFSKEIAEHSIPAIQALVENQMLEDTAELLDALYLDAEARTADRPAGMQDTTETGAGNINASTGSTVAAIIADTKAMIGRMLAARTGDGAVWVMNPLRVLGLRDLQDAASGEFVFRAELAAGTFRGYPFIESQNVTADLVVLQSNRAVTYGNDYAPRIEVSDETALVYDDTAPDNILPDTNTQPAKSMFQIDAIAVKFKQGLDWRITRIGGVQVLTGVDW